MNNNPLSLYDLPKDILIILISKIRKDLEDKLKLYEALVIKHNCGHEGCEEYELTTDHVKTMTSNGKPFKWCFLCDVPRQRKYYCSNHTDTYLTKREEPGPYPALYICDKCIVSRYNIPRYK
jgi:hypothetical protein